MGKEASMSSKASSKKTGSRAEKRARFEGQTKKGGASPLVLVVGLVVALALIGGTVLVLTRPSPAVSESPSNAAASDLGSNLTGDQGLLVSAATHGHEPYPLAVAEDGAVRFPMSTFDDKQAHYYTYMHDGQPIEFFVLESNDGVVRAAFNACDVCYQSKKGYTQDGDEVICNNCGRRFPADQINVVQGGCNPSPLVRTVERDTLVILVEDILSGAGYF
jgi:hypothetical protein